jgi:hypothetical protein
MSSVARLIDEIVVAATNPIKHSTGLSGSVQFSTGSAVVMWVIYAVSLTIEAQ